MLTEWFTSPLKITRFYDDEMKSIELYIMQMGDCQLCTRLKKKKEEENNDSTNRSNDGDALWLL